MVRCQVTGLNYWGEDCLAFGTATNCTGKLDVILTRLQLEPLLLDAASVYDPLVPRRRPQGTMMSECSTPNCNLITEDCWLVRFVLGLCSIRWVLSGPVSVAVGSVTHGYATWASARSS
eukprot:Skav229870  [mRNA]  locus=scaffold247:121912:122858:+ [translate_table: standard]